MNFHISTNGIFMFCLSILLGTFIVASVWFSYAGGPDTLSNPGTLEISDNTWSSIWSGITFLGTLFTFGAMTEWWQPPFLMSLFYWFIGVLFFWTCVKLARGTE